MSSPRAEGASEANERRPRTGRRLAECLARAGFWFWWMATSFAAVVLLYIYQPDATYALTIYSPVVPGLIGHWLALFPAAHKRSKPLFALSIVWLGWGLLATDEVHSLLSSGPDEAELLSFRYDGRRVRIVSFNCAGGQIQAVKEVIPWNPDLVLLQECPPRKELAPIAKAMFGPQAGIVMGPDCAILSRYPLRPLLPEKRVPGPANFVLAHVETPSGLWLVASLRLAPPVLRFDYWNPECWRAYADDRRRRRQELREVLKTIHAFDDLEPMIIGGDFNAPPDRSLRLAMAERGGFPEYPLIETARVAGSGWSLTAVNAFPMVRIDQVWVDPRFEPFRTIARQTSSSDHRLVVADVMIRK